MAELVWAGVELTVSDASAGAGELHVAAADGLGIAHAVPVQKGTVHDVGEAAVVSVGRLLRDIAYISNSL